MFITLKNPNRPNDTAMEQVAARNASSASVPSRSIRKAACIACQAKKLRCTGRGRSCDRCKSRLIACIFPDSPAKPRASAAAAAAAPPSAQGPPTRTNGGGGETLEPSNHPLETEDEGGRDRSPSFAQLHQTVMSALDVTTEGGFMAGDFTDLNKGMDFDFDLLSQDQGNTPSHASALMSISANGAGVDTNQDSASHFLSIQSQALITPPRSDPGRDVGDDAVSLHNNNNNNSVGHQHRGSGSGSSSSPPACACIHETVRVVQQLDDDEFHITTLSLDQVLQLQKWLIAQCCKPLDCGGCATQPSVHTVLLIICDRLTEMFECIHKRIRRVSSSGGAGAAPGLVASPPPPPPRRPQPQSLTPPSDGDDPLLLLRPGRARSRSQPAADARAQLFDSSSGRAAGAALCNPDLFSLDFRNQYSDEEQVHMIRVLLRLQVRNFRQLLARVDGGGAIRHVAGSQARRSKLGAMAARLEAAASDIEDALQDVLKMLIGS
ncbi:hypothetical protein GGS23DRAFT_615675 [Durotheca rogersii]|uniref:uncharacterized protein n=1 Tax=Durotheca rogersii TaxID=419775 RepID=UPI00221FBCDC|nr:uncharacterized protein GGS23DRAFT_615675 [Durotheca rogersii]KAI5867007.1 hypothetical protein GGS23DRAFT_615675 [Durotheca rogersii]